MLNILKNQRGMNIVGQGGKIILFTLPSLIAVILVHMYLPLIAVLPEGIGLLKPVGYILLAIGLIFWGSAVIQLMIGFSKGKLITTGAYGIVRNPIYSSATFFILPAIALMTLTWIYFIVSFFLYIGVMIFIGKEEKQLSKVFGKEYEDYKARVDRMIPFKKPSGTWQQEPEMIRKVLLLCGILSSLLYIAMNIICAMKFEGYNSISQTVSELSAIGAPSKPTWMVLGVFYNLFMIAFGLGVWMSANGKRALRVVSILLLAYAVIGFLWMFFAPMHLRGEGFTLTDTMHIVFAAVTAVMIFIAIGFGAAAFKKWFRYYSIVTIVWLFVFGGLSGLEGPKVAANLPTPLVGLWERINIAGFLLWIVMLAIVLIRVQVNKYQEDIK